ncbi:MAG: sarcosine oxidase subunit gamma [Proteobacteria bacterium]|nr:sarcosine oxidase subunit gamma [Pseudomonadota bacterium]
MSEALITAKVLHDCGHINLRGRRNDAAFVAAVESVCATSLPQALTTAASGDLRIYWLGPDEWSLVTTAEKTAALLAALNGATAGMHVAVNDLSAAFVTLALGGSKVRELLAKGCTIDLHPAAFASGACAHTGLAKAGVLLALQHVEFRLIVRRSFADYLLQWLHRSGAEYGIEFV